VKACVAYTHITIPTLESVEKQINLLFLSAEVALMNGLIGETESLLSKIIQLLSDNFKDDFSSLEYLTRIINRMLGFLVVVPSNPED
jgi:hypothetical protein